MTPRLEVLLFIFRAQQTLAPLPQALLQHRMISLQVCVVSSSPSHVAADHSRRAGTSR